MSTYTAAENKKFLEEQYLGNERFFTNKIKMNKRTMKTSRGGKELKGKKMEHRKEKI